jgi:nicotinate phosphoribosyltransferase
MQAAIHKHYPNTKCEFLLTNRTPAKKLNKAAYDWFSEQIHSLGNLKFTDEELDYLRKKLGYLGEEHFKWLSTIKLNPDNEIKIIPEITNDDEYNLKITASGNWDIVTLYEIPVLALLSECYFRFIDTKWKINGNSVAEFNNGIEIKNNSNYEIVFSQGFEKAEKLLKAGCVFSEFGTRRRRSFQVQHSVMQGIMSVVLNSKYNGKFLGTSNVLLAKEFNVEPIGTIGHEWMMGVGAVLSMKSSNPPNYDAYLIANKLAMQQYVELVGPPNAGLALTDTYGTNNYLSQFNEPYLSYYIGVRQDSGDPETYAREVSKWYKKMGHDDKLICFSDSLNVNKCIKLKNICDLPDVNIKCSFGIGTNLTNDFDSEPMNIVMKLLSCGGGHAIKLSDNISKNMGDKKTVLEVKKRLGYIEHDWEGSDEAHRWKK